jgi:F-type H+-transporting ATPase subunit delta
MAQASQVYARAAFEVSQVSGSTPDLIAGLRSFWESCSESDVLLATVTRPNVSVEARVAVVRDLGAALGINPLALRILLLLAKRSRLGVVPEIIAELNVALDRVAGVQSGELRTAVELSADDMSRLSAALAKKIGSKIRLSQSLQPDLLGGFVATVGGKTYDASLKSQLNRFKNELI